MSGPHDALGHHSARVHHGAGQADIYGSCESFYLDLEREHNHWCAQRHRLL